MYFFSLEQVQLDNLLILTLLPVLSLWRIILMEVAIFTEMDTMEVALML